MLNKIKKQEKYLENHPQNFCYDCGFAYSKLYRRKDDKMFCQDCLPDNQKTLKMPNKNFCSGCGFEPSIPKQGDFQQRSDGNWYHYLCGIREKNILKMFHY